MLLYREALNQFTATIQLMKRLHWSEHANIQQLMRQKNKLCES